MDKLTIPQRLDNVIKNGDAYASELASIIKELSQAAQTAPAPAPAPVTPNPA